MYIYILKSISEVFKNAPLHVIGENNFDSTLPLAHAVTSKESKKDLINTQAINARGLVQALAFPTMQPAVAQLFHDTPGNPSLRLWLHCGTMEPQELPKRTRNIYWKNTELIVVLKVF